MLEPIGIINVTSVALDEAEHSKCLTNDKLNMLVKCQTSVKVNVKIINGWGTIFFNINFILNCLHFFLVLARVGPV